MYSHPDAARNSAPPGREPSPLGSTLSVADGIISECVQLTSALNAVHSRLMDPKPVSAGVASRDSVAQSAPCTIEGRLILQVRALNHLRSELQEIVAKLDAAV